MPVIATQLSMARRALARGETDTWQRLLIELERCGQLAGSSRPQCSAWLERARVATLNHHLEVAQLALQTAQRLDEPSDDSLPGGEIDTLMIARQRLRIAQGHHDAASQDLLVAISNVPVSQPRYLQIKLHLLLAIAHEGRPHRRLAMRAFEQALRLASDQGFSQCFLEEGDAVVALLRRWVSRRGARLDPGIDPLFVARVLELLGVAPEHVEGDRSAALTPRETQVLQLLACGYRNRAIAEQLFLSESTIKSHLHSINIKLGARSRTEALAIARDHGWLD